MYKKQITYYFQSGVLEGILALIFLFLIPSDPKNSWFLGYSKNRLLLSIALILMVSPHLLLSYFSLKKPEFTQKLSHILDSVLEIYGFPLPVLLLLWGLFAFGPYLEPFTYLKAEAIKIRLLPLILYLSSRFIQLVLVITAMIRIRIKQGIQMKFSRRNLIAYLSYVTGFLVSTHLSTSFIMALDQETILYREAWRLNKYFNLTYEFNLPAYYSSVILGLAGGILLIIAIKKIRLGAKFRFQWLFLSLTFFYLAIDELLALHEDLGKYAVINLGEENLIIQDWAYAGIVIVVLFIILLLPFFIHLPPGHKLRFFTSAALYVGGFLGVEIIGSFYEIRNGIQEIPYVLFTTVEETLEMVGVIYFINALMIYLEEIKGIKFLSRQSEET